MAKTLLTPLLTLFLLLQADPAWALRTHGDQEGLYVHHMAHLLFAVALAYLWWHTRKTQAVTSNGWRLLQMFYLLTILWNLLAILGLEACQRLDPGDCLGHHHWGEQVVLPLDLLKTVHLLSSMDHLLLIPALAALALALRTFYREALRVEER